MLKWLSRTFKHKAHLFVGFGLLYKVLHGRHVLGFGRRLLGDTGVDLGRSVHFNRTVLTLLLTMVGVLLQLLLLDGPVSALAMPRRLLVGLLQRSSYVLVETCSASLNVLHSLLQIFWNNW